VREKKKIRSRHLFFPEKRGKADDGNLDDENNSITVSHLQNASRMYIEILYSNWSIFQFSIFGFEYPYGSSVPVQQAAKRFPSTYAKPSLII
jgi:hypothetical protein